MNGRNELVQRDVRTLRTEERDERRGRSELAIGVLELVNHGQADMSQIHRGVGRGVPGRRLIVEAHLQRRFVRLQGAREFVSHLDVVINSVARFVNADIGDDGHRVIPRFADAPEPEVTAELPRVRLEMEIVFPQIDRVFRFDRMDNVLPLFRAFQKVPIVGHQVAVGGQGELLVRMGKDRIRPVTVARRNERPRLDRFFLAFIIELEIDRIRRSEKINGERLLVGDGEKKEASVQLCRP